MTPHIPSNLMLASGDWGYLVALLVFSIVTWIVNALKKRQEEAAKGPGQTAGEAEETEETEPAEVLGPDESPFPFPPPGPPPPIRRTAEPLQPPTRPAPPMAMPAARPLSPASPPSRETRVKEPRQRVILAESPTPRASDIEPPTKVSIARVADIKPLAREEDMLDAFGRPSRAAVQERVSALASAELPAATSASATFALLRQLRAAGSPLPRQAILLSEVLSPPLAFRRQTPGLPPSADA